MPLLQRTDRPRSTARALWLAIAVLFAGAIVSALQRRDDTALLFAGIAFELVFVVESNFDWQRRITRSNWQRSVFESSTKTSAFGKCAQVMAFICIAGSLWIGRH